MKTANWQIEIDREWVENVISLANEVIPEDYDRDIDLNLFIRYWGKKHLGQPLQWPGPRLCAEQAKLIAVLDAFAKNYGKRRAYERIAAEGPLLREVRMEVHPVSGKVTLSTSTKTTSFSQWWTGALTPVIQRRWTKQIRRCLDPRCKKFFIDWPKQGPNQLYCCKRHQDRHRKRIKRGSS